MHTSRGREAYVAPTSCHTAAWDGVNLGSVCGPSAMPPRRPHIQPFDSSVGPKKDKAPTLRALPHKALHDNNLLLARANATCRTCALCGLFVRAGSRVYPAAVPCHKRNTTTSLCPHSHYPFLGCSAPRGLFSKPNPPFTITGYSPPEQLTCAVSELLQTDRTRSFAASLGSLCLNFKLAWPERALGVREGEEGVSAESKSTYIHSGRGRAVTAACVG